MARKRTFRETVDALTSTTKPLRGTIKLSTALDAFNIDVSDRICLDVGASTGGFTTALLERGASRVYAVDAGHGQLLGSLRQDVRVVNLEATNVAVLDEELVPDAIDIASIDVSYLSLREAVEQLDRVRFAPDAQLVGLIKPMFELKLADAPTDQGSLDRATRLAMDGITATGWEIVDTMPSPVAGGKGAIEGFVHARRPITVPA